MFCIFGATGNQGNSIAEYMLDSCKDWKLRGICRDVDDKCAMELKKKGVEMMSADMAKDSVDRLAECMKGCYGCFLMTNFWDPNTMNKEVAQGKKLVDAAKKAGVKCIFWSTLPNVKKYSGLDVPHFTDKALVEEYIREMQEKEKCFEYCIFLAPSFYYQNFKNFFPPKKEGDTMVFNIPYCKYLTSMDIDEMGMAVCNCLKNPKEFNMKRIDFYGTHQGLQQYIDDFSKATGMKAKLNTMPADEWMKTGKEGAEEMGNMFKWFDKYGYYPESDRTLSGKATGKLTPWQEWAKNQDWTEKKTQA
jgi:uncharacterized protein YbjT (DUF2867 family)